MSITLKYILSFPLYRSYILFLSK